MNRHGCMNHIYRVVWSEARNAWIAVAEITRGRAKVSRRRLVVAALSFGATAVIAEPLGGQVIAGAGDITRAGLTTTVTQSTQNLSVDWQSFNIATAETVNFVQPSAAAIAVNRILDPNGTQVLGRLNANGQVYLINPNGVLFGRNAQVNVGGLVASTLQADYVDGESRSFSGNGTGSIINQGTINAVTGGYVALLGNNVSNQGVITAHLGSVALGAGSAVTLIFSGNTLVRMQVDQSVLNSVADNGGLIRANGGMVMMSAGANDALLASVVNNTGVIEARTVENRNGTIVLLGGMSAGSANVGGILDASAPSGGNGGFVETSAAHVRIANDTNVTTAAASGRVGTWLIDPFDFTIAPTGGDTTGAVVSANLVNGNVAIQTSTGTIGGIEGDLNVNDTVTWSANQLTLSAYDDININAQMNGSGTAVLALEYGQGSVAAGNLSEVIVHAPVNLPAGPNFSTRVGSDGVAKNFTVITALGIAGSITATDLQGMSGDVAGDYALGANIDAATTTGWNSGLGFMPVGTFTGTFDGLGHIISGLTINRPASDLVGLFASTGASAVISNLGLEGGSISGRTFTGALVGLSAGSITHSHSSAVVVGSFEVGGLAGAHSGVIDNSYATGAVSGTDSIGGLAGTHTGVIINSYATGAVSGNDAIGGLVGEAQGATIDVSYSTGLVTGNTNVGGLLGLDASLNTITNSYWNVTTSGQATSDGGSGLTSTQMLTAANFPGFNFTATPAASGNNWVIVDVDSSLNNAGAAVGGTFPLLASEYSQTISNAHQLQLIAMAPAASYTLNANIDAAATANSNDVWGVAGFVPIGSTGIPFNGAFDGQSHVISTLTINLATANVGLFGNTASGAVIGNVGLVGGSVTGAAGTGGLVGNNGAGNAIVNSFNTGVVSGAAGTGGLVGSNTTGSISNSYTTGNVTGAAGTGGLVGSSTSGAISLSYSTGDVNGAAGTGGLIGSNTSGPVSNTYATGDVVSSGAGTGGLIGSSTSGLVSNSYSTGSVSSIGAGIGGLIGSGTALAVTNSYWDTQTSGQAASPGGGEGRSSAQMKLQATFQTWDFGSTWLIEETITSPLLLDLMTQLVVTANDLDTTYNAVAHSGGNGVTYSAPLNGIAPAGALGYGGTSQGAINAGSYAITPNGLVSNQQYLISFASGTLTIAPADLTVSTSNVSKTYDSGLTALGTATVASGTLFSTDSLSGGSFAFTDKNVGIGSKTVTTSGVTVNDGNSGNSGNNYSVSYVNNTTSTITAANLAVTGVSAVGTRVYDGTAAAALAGTAAVTALGSDVVSLGGTGTGVFADRNVGTAKTITVNGFTLSGTDANNYSLVQPGGLTANVTAAALTLSTSNVSKTYDSGLDALGTTVITSGSLSSPDTISGGSFAFTDKNVGSGNKVVTTSGVTVNDGNSGNNYSVSYASNTTSTVTPANLAVTGVSAVGTRVYDGTSAAALAGTAVVTALGSDVVSLGGTGTGVFINRNVGTAKSITVSGFSLSGTDAGNYSLMQPSGLTANVTAAALTLSTSNVSKTYDSGLTALGTASVSSGTLFSLDTISGGSFAFTDKNAGGGKTVTATAITVNDGNNGGNYAVTYASNTTSTITPASIAVTGVSPGGTKVYDGSPSAALGGTAEVSAFGSDVVTIGNTGSGVFADRNAGTGKNITVTGFTITGADAGNYAIVQPTGLTADITAANITLSSSNVTKTYDGELSATGTASVTSGTLFDGDTLAGGTFTFTNKNAGVDKVITADAVSVGDGNHGGNYNVSYANNTTSTINAAPLAVNGMAGMDKVYDGTAAASLSGTATVNAIGDDLVSVGGTGIGAFDDPSVGANKSVAVLGFTLSGADAGNYSIVQPMGLTADVTAVGAPPVMPPEVPVAPRQALPGEVAQLESDVLKSQSSGQEKVSQFSIASKETHECGYVSAPSGEAVSLEWDDCTSVNIEGVNGPRLQIINGGVRLPDTMVKGGGE